MRGVHNGAGQRATGALKAGIEPITCCLFIRRVLGGGTAIFLTFHGVRRVCLGFL